MTITLCKTEIIPFTPGICFPMALHSLAFTLVHVCPRVLFIQRGDREPSQTQPGLGVGLRGQCRLWLWNLDPGHNVQHSVSDFLISTESNGQLATGISSVTTGCCSCEPLFPVAVEIHWEISWEIVQNGVVGLILTLATAVAKTSGKDQILLVSCCQVLEKTDFITCELEFEMESKCLLMQH